MTAVEEKTQTLNKLLRGELSAVETYEQALAKVGDEVGGSTLRDILRQHRLAAETLREHVERFGGQPATGSGAWGTFASAVIGTAKLFGNQTAWEALKQGEEHGVSLYETALDDEHLADECRNLIATNLLPAQQRHIAALDSIQTVASR